MLDMLYYLDHINRIKSSGFEGKAFVEIYSPYSQDPITQEGRLHIFGSNDGITLCPQQAGGIAAATAQIQGPCPSSRLSRPGFVYGT